VQFHLDRPLSSLPCAAFDDNSGSPVLSAILRRSRYEARSSTPGKAVRPLGIEDVNWAPRPRAWTAGRGPGLYLQAGRVDMARLGRHLWLADGGLEGPRLMAPLDRHVRPASVDMGLVPLLRYANLFWSEPAKAPTCRGAWIATAHRGHPTSCRRRLTRRQARQHRHGIPSTPKSRSRAVPTWLNAAFQSDERCPGSATLSLGADKRGRWPRARTQSAPPSPLAAAFSSVYALQPNPM